MIATLLGLLLATSGQNTKAEQVPSDEGIGHVAKAVMAIRAGDSASAGAELDRANTYYDALYASEKRRVYCGMSGPQTIAYMSLAARDRVDAIAILPGRCEALFLKGYTLVDAGQVDEARKYYDRVRALAPFHWQYIAETAYTYRDTDPTKSFELYKRAEGLVGLANQPEQVAAQAKVRHGEGYALSELKRFDEAEAIYRLCLKENASDELAQRELAYIAGQRAKP